MTTFVALLRAVNVAGNKVEMAALRSGLTGLGFEGVQTYVQSGNVVFRAEGAEEAEGDDPRAHAAAIASLIADQTGLDVTVLVLTAAELAEVAAANPFAATGADEKTLHVTFLAEPADEAAFAALKLPAQDGEQVVLGDRVVYLWLPHGYGRSKLSNAYLERVLRLPATTRNWRTVKTLVELSSVPA
jgi:uncharacterized protein (DUF1697 family)